EREHEDLTHEVYELSARLASSRTKTTTSYSAAAAAPAAAAPAPGPLRLREAALGRRSVLWHLGGGLGWFCWPLAQEEEPAGGISDGQGGRQGSEDHGDLAGIPWRRSL
ncbi:unnamed protein product, partial [Ectocarpus sp. 12 AP-2014]